MKVVIDISEEIFIWIKEHKGLTDFQTTTMLYDAVRNGTPLPVINKCISGEGSNG